MEDFRVCPPFSKYMFVFVFNLLLVDYLAMGYFGFGWPTRPPGQRTGQRDKWTLYVKSDEINAFGISERELRSVLANVKQDYQHRLLPKRQSRAPWPLPSNSNCWKKKVPRHGIIGEHYTNILTEFALSSIIVGEKAEQLSIYVLYLFEFLFPQLTSLYKILVICLFQEILQLDFHYKKWTCKINLKKIVSRVRLLVASYFGNYATWFEPSRLLNLYIWCCVSYINWDEYTLHAVHLWVIFLLLLLNFWMMNGTDEVALVRQTTNSQQLVTCRCVRITRLLAFCFAVFVSFFLFPFFRLWCCLLGRTELSFFSCFWFSRRRVDEGDPNCHFSQRCAVCRSRERYPTQHTQGPSHLISKLSLVCRPVRSSWSVTSFCYCGQLRCIITSSGIDGTEASP